MLINYPLRYRSFLRVNPNTQEEVTVVYHPKSLRVVYGPLEEMYKPILDCSKSMIEAGCMQIADGRFEAHANAVTKTLRNI